MAILISSVTPANIKGVATGSAVTDLIEPNTFKWAKQDLSSSDSGRTADLKMVKMLQGKTRTLQLEWKYPTFADAAIIMAAFDHEYLLITYMDALTGTYKTSHMYVGDMEANCYSAIGDGRWESVSFHCIQSTPDAV